MRSSALPWRTLRADGGLIDHYVWRGGREAMLRFGPATGPVVVLALPLFEEANRVRALAVTVCRTLADRGIASVIPDLPGQGESLVPFETCTLADLQNAFQAVSDTMRAASRPARCIAIRSGALVVPPRLECWSLSPQDKADLLRQLGRIRHSGTLKNDPVPPERIAGNPISAAFLAELASPDADRVSGTRTVRLVGDPRAADRYVAGNPLWRRAEPGTDPALAQVVVEDIAAWIAPCAM